MSLGWMVLPCSWDVVVIEGFVVVEIGVTVVVGMEVVTV